MKSASIYVAALIAAALMLIIASASARADFSNFQWLSGPTHEADEPQAAVATNGDAVFVWRSFDGSYTRIQGRTLSAAGVLGPILNFSKPSQETRFPRIAVDPNGNAVVAWIRWDGANHRIQLRTLSAAGVLGPIQNLSRPGQEAFDPQVAVDVDGDAVITWHGFDGANWRIKCRTRYASGVLGKVRNLSHVGRDALNPQVAVDAGGNAVFTWIQQRDSADSPYKVSMRSLSAAGTLGPIRLVSAVGYRWSAPEVAVTSNGKAVFVWRRNGGRAIEARTLSATGVFGPILTLSYHNDSSVFDILDSGPQVALNSGGDAAFTWRARAFPYLPGRAIQARTLSAAGVLGSIQTLSDRGPGFDPHVAANGVAMLSLSGGFPT